MNMIFVLTSNNELINLSNPDKIFLKGNKITASYPDGDLTLEIFGVDEKYVAEDVFNQLIFAIDGSSGNKVINLADISKRAKYEYRTGKRYTE